LHDECLHFPAPNRLIHCSIRPGPHKNPEKQR
jgi:hypothetical protein